ncbi:MAG: HD-GYP domain-containing protein [Burkholderiaceae bacterium]
MTRPFDRANEYALASLLEASRTRDIAASEDIVDDHGRKLWACGQPIRSELMERLLVRTLRRPIEQCLTARDGIAAADVVHRIEQLLDGDRYLAALMGGSARHVLDVARTLPLDGPASLLLTAAEENGRGFEHACLVTLIAGGLAARAGVGDATLQRVVLGGLLHDLGELYVNPDYLHSRRELSLDEWRHVAAHPRIGALFVRENTRYGATISAIVDGHHERDDGSGYPSRATAETLREEAGWVIVAETMAGVMNDPVSAPARTLLAIGLVFGEYRLAQVGLVASTQRAFPIEADPGFDGEAARAEIDALRTAMRAAHVAARVAELRTAGMVERRCLARLAPLLRRLDIAFVSSGAAHFFELLGTSAEAGDGEVALQLRLVPRELRWRMRSLARDVAHDLRGFTDDGRLALAPLLEALRGAPAAPAASPRSTTVA